MKYLVILSLLLSGCTVVLRDERLDPAAVSAVLKQHQEAIKALTEHIIEKNAESEKKE